MSKLKNRCIRRVYKNKFCGLDKYKKSPFLYMKNNQLYYPLKENGTKDLGNQIGEYFVLLGQGIYGGVLKENYKDHENGYTVEPDLISDDQKYAREFKTIRAGERVKLEDIQISKYIYLLKDSKETNGCFPIISYEIFKHRVSDIFKRFKGRPTGEFVDEISGNILNMVSLPLDVIVKIHSLKGNDEISRDKKWGEKGKFSSRYELGNWYGNCTSFHSPALNNFIFRPEETLKIFGLNPEDYDIEKRKFQKNASMNGKIIDCFPVLIIKNKFYDRWAHNFLENEGQEYIKNYENVLEEKINSQIEIPEEFGYSEEQVPF